MAVSRVFITTQQAVVELVELSLHLLSAAGHSLLHGTPRADSERAE